MKQFSRFTKELQLKYWITVCLDWAIMYLPIIIYIVIVVVGDEATPTGRVALAACVMVALILAFLNAMTKVKLRCPIWIILIGLYVAFSKMLLPLVIIMAVATVMDDFLFAPLITHYRQKLSASKVYDERKREEKQEELVNATEENNA